MEKIRQEMELYQDHYDFLANMADQYDLPDPSKALRVLIDYAMEDGDTEDIFSRIRCLRC